MMCPRCGSYNVETSKFEAKCLMCGNVFQLIPESVKRTFEKYPFAEYCLNCGIFVAYATEHTSKGHIVVRKSG